MIEIEKNVPLPRKRAKYGELPLEGMELNDSFLVPYNEHEVLRLRGLIATKVCMFAKKQLPKWKFTTKAEPDGVRVWRIK
jgi:hypothetical protein